MERPRPADTCRFVTLRDLSPGARFKVPGIDVVFVYTGTTKDCAVGFCDVDQAPSRYAVFDLTAPVELEG